MQQSKERGGGGSPHAAAVEVGRGSGSRRRDSGGPLAVEAVAVSGTRAGGCMARRAGGQHPEQPIGRRTTR
jgi:hypothetical protein